MEYFSLFFTQHRMDLYLYLFGPLELLFYLYLWVIVFMMGNLELYEGKIVDTWTSYFLCV